MSFDRQNLAQQKSNNASALYAPTLVRYGNAASDYNVIYRNNQTRHVLELE